MGKSRMNEATPIVIRKMLKETLLKEAYARAEQKKMEKVGGIVVVVAAAAAAVRVIAITWGTKKLERVTLKIVLTERPFPPPFRTQQTGEHPQGLSQAKSPIQSQYEEQDASEAIEWQHLEHARKHGLQQADFVHDDIRKWIWRLCQVDSAE